MNALLRVLATSLAASLVTSLVGFLLSGAALAQVPDRVGRIAYLSGDVQFYSESAQAWVPAQLNAPVSSRNSLYTGSGGRAEIRFGSTAVALDAQTQLDIQLLDDSSFKAGVTRGSVSLRVPRIEDGESYEVMAPAATYSVLQPGRFRVDATDRGSSVTVLAGLVNAAVAGGGSVMVETGQALSAADGGFVRSAARSTALDSWVVQRDGAYRASQSARYVSPNMTGYEDLDANGRWASDPDYGTLWYPTTYVSAGWVPYRDGHWAYVPPWGWTWIDDAPWGFAPFHYGRWVLVGSRWGWMPGVYVRRPVYAPALVGFIGGSTASGVAISIFIGSQPAVGWYPLPPWERYQPSYVHRSAQVQVINNFNISTPPANAWRTVDNRRLSVNQVQGATVVPHAAFVDSRPVRRAVMSVPAPVLAAPLVAASPVVAPRSAILAPAGSARPEFGERRGAREADRGREPVAVPLGGNAPPAPAVQSIRPESRPSLFRGENRAAERQTAPAIVAPAASQPAPAPRVDNPPPRRVLPPVSSPESAVVAPARREGGERGAPVAVPEPIRQIGRPPVVTPEPVAPRGRPEPRIEPRVEPRAVPEARVEPRPEPRAVPRVEPRMEARPEPRPMPRVEPPPQARTPPPPQAQPEQKRGPEQEHERHQHGERGRD